MTILLLVLTVYLGIGGYIGLKLAEADGDETFTTTITVFMAFMWIPLLLMFILFGLIHLITILPSPIRR